MAPARVVFTAELTGGANDFEDFYCGAVEWEWGDGTKSESSSDCAPYEPGKSEIKRRFTVEHVFRLGRPNGYRVTVHLKRRDKSVGAATVNVRSGPASATGSDSDTRTPTPELRHRNSDTELRHRAVVERSRPQPDGRAPAPPGGYFP